MHIEPFGVEIWMNAWETKCTYNLAETCVHSLTIAELLQITGANDTDLLAMRDLKMTYGDITGSPQLRSAIAGLYQNRGANSIMVTHGTIGANMLVFRAMIGPEDEVITVMPTYQQHYSIPESLGATVKPLWLRPESAWLPDLDELADLITPRTKMIALTNPNNPTGALIEGDLMADLIALAERHDLWILADEVYRGTNAEDPGTSPSIADLYAKGISTAGMSKAFSLAGLRLGWVAAPDEVIEAVSIHRDYDTISVGVLDDHMATIALQNADKILTRSRTPTRTNRAIVDDWLAGDNPLSWIKPKAGTTALLKLPDDVASKELCEDLLQNTGVLLTPGSAMHIDGYVRLGYANATSILQDGLGQFASYLGDKGY